MVDTKKVELLKTPLLSHQSTQKIYFKKISYPVLSDEPATSLKNG
jgi:hypothetical protein